MADISSQIPAGTSRPAALHVPASHVGNGPAQQNFQFSSLFPSWTAVKLWFTLTCAQLHLSCSTSSSSDVTCTSGPDGGGDSSLFLFALPSLNSVALDPLFHVFNCRSISATV